MVVVCRWRGWGIARERGTVDAWHSARLGAPLDALCSARRELPLVCRPRVSAFTNVTVLEAVRRCKKWPQMLSAGNPPLEACSQLADARAEPAVGAREVGVQEREPGARLPPPSRPRSPFSLFTAAHFSFPWTDCRGWGDGPCRWQLSALLSGSRCSDLQGPACTPGLRASLPDCVVSQREVRACFGGGQVDVGEPQGRSPLCISSADVHPAPALCQAGGQTQVAVESAAGRPISPLRVRPH